MAGRCYLRWIVLFALMIAGTLTTVSLFAGAASAGSANHIVISEIQVGGVTANDEFVELYNPTDSAIVLTGWKLTKKTSGGNEGNLISSASFTGTIPAHGFFLIAPQSGYTGLTIPDLRYSQTSNFLANDNAVLLYNQNGILADKVGWGASLDFEGGAYPTNPASKTSIERKAQASSTSVTMGAGGSDELFGNGQDSDNNSQDFVSRSSPQPQNSSSASETLPSAATNTPTATPTPTPILTATLTPTSTATHTPTPASPPAENLLITEVLYDGTQGDEGDEFIEITNPLTHTVDLGGYKIGDEETKGGGEGMYLFPSGTNLAPNAVLLVAKNAAQFRARFGFDPAFELVTSGSGLTDTPTVPNLDKDKTWATGSLALSNSGDEVLLLGPSDELVDSAAWGNGNFGAAGLTGDATAPEPLSLQRYGTQDTNNMTFDFLRDAPHPSALVSPPAPPPVPPPGAAMPGGMFAYWGDLHAHSTASDGSGPPGMAFATARAAGLHFFALTDHDSWLTPEEWNEIGDAANAATVDNAFIALRGFEFTSPDGHANAFNTSTWVSHTDPNYNSLSKFYAWLRAQPGALAQFNHPVWDRGGDFNNMAFNAAGLDVMALQEVGNNAQGKYARFESQYLTALNKHWHVAPTNDSDNHDLTWGSDSPHRVGILAPALTPANVLDALRARRVFATEDSNLALAFQANGAWMGSIIRAQPTIKITVTVNDPDVELVWLDLYDNGKIVNTQWFAAPSATWTLEVKGNSSHYYFVRATQADGDLAYTAPIWTDNTPTDTRENPWNLGRVSIDTARTARIGARVELEGCVTVAPGVFSDRYMFIQDQTGGIKSYLPSQTGDLPALRDGDRVALRGRTGLNYGEHEVIIEDAKTIRTLGVCAPVTAKQIATGGIGKDIEGMLVEVAGAVKSIGRGEFVLNDGSGDALVYIDSTTTIQLPRLAVGQPVRVIGVVSRAHGRSAVLPRDATDMIVAPTPTATLAPRATSTRTPTAAPRVSAPAARATSTRVPVAPSATLRAFTRPTPAPLQAAATIDAQAAAVAGGSASVAGSFVLFAVAAAMLRRR